MSRLLIVLSAILVLILIIEGWLLGPAMQEEIVPGVGVWGISLSGLGEEAAEQALRQNNLLNQSKIVLIGPEGQRWTYTPEQLGLTVDYQATAAQAFALGHGQSGLASLQERYAIMTQGAELAPVLIYDENKTFDVLESLAAELVRDAQDAQVAIQNSELVLTQGTQGRQLTIEQAFAAIQSELLQLETYEYVLPIEVVSPQISDALAEQLKAEVDVMLSEAMTLLLVDPQNDDPGPWVIPPDALARMLVISIAEDSYSVTLDEAQLAQFLSPIALELYRDPVDATFAFDAVAVELNVVTPHIEGREVNVNETVVLISDSLLNRNEHFIPMVLNVTPPTLLDTMSAADLGIRELVAVGESYFTGSSSSRDKNIKLGASKFDGIMIAPDEVFSFNGYLGDVTPEEGYDESYVIIGGRTVPGVGGGICQVATTAFRAAFFGGYPITERWPHAYRVGYYELGGYGPGFDATIYSPVVDLKFVNDSPYYILVRTQVDTANARLRFLFYSTDTGHKVQQIGPEWGSPIPPETPIYEYDPTMPAGTVKQVESSHNGLNATLGRVVTDADGNVVNEDTFYSNFIPWPARYLFGPSYTPPEGVEVIGLEETE